MYMFSKIMFNKKKYVYAYIIHMVCMYALHRIVHTQIKHIYVLLFCEYSLRFHPL